MEIRSQIRSSDREALWTAAKSFFSRRDTLVGLVASLALCLGSELGYLPFSQIEVFGFVSGAACVWLLVKENIWNWPVGVINAGFFLVLFLQSRLFADSALQLVYIVLGLWGWYYWLKGGTGKRERLIARTGLVEWLVMLALTAAATYVLDLYLVSIKDAAPFWDALTTAISLAATWMQARKLIENWWLWIAADVVYIPLYFYKHLPLTGILYVVFMLMCVRGLIDWRRSLRALRADASAKAALVTGGGKRFQLGVVAMKAYPFHSGHKHLIETALSQCERVAVMVCYSKEDVIPGELRAAWIKATLPAADVIALDQDELGLPDASGDADSQIWALRTPGFIGGNPDAVFSSEDYGARWAQFMGAEHVCVDKERKAIPISGTAIRNDPLGNLGYLEPVVRAYFVKRVLLLGAESTGKSTLARQLAARFQTVWAPEYGHVYTAFRPQGPYEGWQSEEFLHIGQTQNWLEDFLAAYANKVIFVDTDSSVTARFHEELVGHRSKAVEALAGDRDYDLVILTDPETPFQQDELNLRKDGPHRLRMHEAYKARLEASGAPYLEVSGSPAERLAQAAKAVDELLLPEPAKSRPTRLNLPVAGSDRIAALVPQLRIAEGF